MLHTESTKKKIGDKNRVKIRTEKQKQVWREKQLGKHRTKEDINKQKETNSKLPILICLYCGFQSRNKGNMIKSHFDNCKKKPKYIRTS